MTINTVTNLHSTRLKRGAILVAAMAAIALLLLTILPSQSPSSVHRASVVAPVPAEMVPTAIQATSTAAPAVPKAPTPALQSEHVWRLRVFGITVFRYDAKAEGPHR